MTMTSKAGLCGLVLSGLLLLGADARAVEVRYATTGIFTGGDIANSSTYLDAANGIVISFEGAFADFVNTPLGVPSQTSFGVFNTTGTTRPPGSDGANFWPVSSGFTLTITQTLIDGEAADGDLEFVGSLSGQLHSEAGQVWVQFDEPLVQTMTSAGLPIIYGIANADRPTGGSSVPGRVNIAPPSTNNGITTVVGEITPIPEPSAMILVGMGALAPLALTIRNRRKARASA